MTDTSNGNGKDTELKLTKLTLALREGIAQGQKCTRYHKCQECSQTYECQSPTICRMGATVEQCGKCWRKAQGWVA